MKYQQLCTVLRDYLVEEKEIFPEDRLSADLGLCSFDMMVIIERIEELNECHIDLSKIKKNMTVQDFYSIIVNN